MKGDVIYVHIDGKTAEIFKPQSIPALFHVRYQGLMQPLLFKFCHIDRIFMLLSAISCIIRNLCLILQRKQLKKDEFDISQPVPQGSDGAQDAENSRIAAIADQLERLCAIHEAQRGDSLKDVSRFETEHMRTPYKQKDLKKLTSQKEAMDETEYIMSSPAMVEILRQGQKDIEEGRGRVIKLDEIWK